MAYHSHTRFATNKSGVEALMPFCATASSNINLSSSRGRYGSGNFIVDIAAWNREQERKKKPRATVKVKDGSGQVPEHEIGDKLLLGKK